MPMSAVREIDEAFGVFVHLALAYQAAPPVVFMREEGIVELQGEAGIDDGLVFLLQRVGEGDHDLLVVLRARSSAPRPAWAPRRNVELRRMGRAHLCRVLIDRAREPPHAHRASHAPP
jgi:hypothetical protein